MIPVVTCGATQPCQGNLIRSSWELFRQLDLRAPFEHVSIFAADGAQVNILPLFPCPSLADKEVVPPYWLQRKIGFGGALYLERLDFGSIGRANEISISVAGFESVAPTVSVQMIKRQILSRLFFCGMIFAVRVGGTDVLLKISSANIIGDATKVFSVDPETSIALETLETPRAPQPILGSFFFDSVCEEIHSIIDFGLSSTRGIVLVGGDGSGRSSLLSPGIGRSTNLVQARSAGESPQARVIVLDDVDILLKVWDEATALGFLRDLFACLSSAPRIRVLSSVCSLSRMAPSVLKCGLFAHPVPLHPPSFSDRLQLLPRLLSHAELASNQPLLLQLAKSTGGCQIGDLVRICRDIAIRRETSFLPLEEIAVSAVAENEPVGLSGVSRPPPRQTVIWDRVAGFKGVKSRLEQLVLWPLERPELYSKLGIEASCGVLLHGPSGCGKTYIASALSSVASANFIVVNGPELFQRYLGESEEAVKNVFTTARSTAPCILFFDELDSIASARGGNSDDANGVYERVLSVLLNEMDGISSRRGDVVVVGCTNRLDLLDSAIIRPGRFITVHVGHPTTADIEELLRDFVRQTPVSDLDYSLLAASLAGLENTTADIQSVCREATYTAMRAGCETVEMGHFLVAIETNKRRRTKEVFK